MPSHTYVLISEEGFHYTGSCANLNHRLENLRKKTTHFTKKGTYCSLPEAEAWFPLQV